MCKEDSDLSFRQIKPNNYNIFSSEFGVNLAEKQWIVAPKISKAAQIFDERHNMEMQATIDGKCQIRNLKLSLRKLRCIYVKVCPA